MNKYLICVFIYIKHEMISEKLKKKKKMYKLRKLKNIQFGWGIENIFDSKLSFLREREIEVTITNYIKQSKIEIIQCFYAFSSTKFLGRGGGDETTYSCHICSCLKCSIVQQVIYAL